MSGRAFRHRARLILGGLAAIVPAALFEEKREKWARRQNEEASAG